MANIPKKIKIGDVVWTVEERENLINRKGVECWGVCDSHEYKFLIERAAPLARKREALLHEICHALFIFFLNKDDDKYTEEEVCEFMGKGLPMVLRDNPRLAHYLLEK